jgi:hypothetical protein
LNSMFHQKRPSTFDTQIWRNTTLFLGDKLVNTGAWPSRLGSLKWDSKMWSWVLRDFDPRVTALARLRSNSTVNYRTVLSSERAL